MAFPFSEIVVGSFALLVASVTGIFTVFNTKINRKVNAVETKVEKNQSLTLGNDIFSELLPALERKDEALDKIADVLENVLEIQRLQNQRLGQIEQLVKLKCEAPELIAEFEKYIELKGRKGVHEDLIKGLLEKNEDI
jgi:hypothetical protein